MIHKDQLSQYLDLYPEHKVVFDNVQTELDRSKAENDQARLSAVGKPYAFDYFPPWADVNAWMTEMVQTYPNYASRVSIGSTYQGTGIVGLHISTAAATAPAFFIHCTIHAREWITTTTCCYIIEQLLSVDTNYLQYYNWVIIPVLNIDGYSFTHTNTRLWRKNRQPNSGSTCAGTDLNRNYGTGFGGGGSSGDPCADTYRGTSAFSGPEINSERNYINNWNGPVAAFVDIHAYGAMWMSPWGYTCTYPPAGDYNEMNRLMVASVAAVRGINGRSYSYGSTCNTIYQASGGSNDYTYQYFGIIPSYAIECYGTSFTAPVSQILPIGREIYAGILALANQIGTQ